MKRTRQRLSLLAAIRLSIGLVLFAVIWEIVKGKSDATSGLAFIGLLIFLVSEAWFSGEANLAVDAVNARVDDQIRHDMARDARIAALERRLGVDLDPRDTPPHGIPVYRPEGPR